MTLKLMKKPIRTYKFTDKKWGFYKKYEDVAYVYFSQLEQALIRDLVASKVYPM